MANVVYLSDMREPEQCLHSNNNKKQIMNMATFVTAEKNVVQIFSKMPCMSVFVLAC